MYRKEKETCWSRHEENCNEQPHKWEADYSNDIVCTECGKKIYDELAVRGNPFLMVEVLLTLAKENKELKDELFCVEERLDDKIRDLDMEMRTMEARLS